MLRDDQSVESRVGVDPLRQADGEPLRVAFFVWSFPELSETFVIDQVAYLRSRGVDVTVFSVERGDTTHASEKFFSYGMSGYTHYLATPERRLTRVVQALPKLLRLAVRHPRVLIRALDVFRYGRDAASLRLLYAADAVAGRDFDIVHCHFGYMGLAFLPIREVTGLKAKVVTTFYGVDVSRDFLQEPADHYDRLKEVCSLFFVMSEDMRRRVVAHGFPEDQVVVHPVGIELADYDYRVRALMDGEALQLAFVGRFVEKKGLDDLLRAMAIVKDKSSRPVHCSIVGGGELESTYRDLASTLDVDDVVDFRGFTSIENVLELLADVHVLVQPSKTAADGDME